MSELTFTPPLLRIIDEEGELSDALEGVLGESWAHDQAERAWAITTDGVLPVLRHHFPEVRDEDFLFKVALDVTENLGRLAERVGLPAFNLGRLDTYVARATAQILLRRAWEGHGLRSGFSNKDALQFLYAYKFPFGKMRKTLRDFSERFLTDIVRAFRREVGDTSDE